MIKLYVAGKVSKDSVFGTHYWRDAFCKKLEELSNLQLRSLDPTKTDIDQNDARLVFGADCTLISDCDTFIVYLSNDISVGGSQEILIAQYFSKPVIGFAPYGGKFNGSTKEFFGKVVENYKDPFVFTTCYIVCGTVEEVAEALKNVHQIIPKNLDIIPDAINFYKTKKTP